MKRLIAVVATPMKASIALAIFVMSAPAAAIADKVDPRLATVRKAWVVAVDDLGEDRPVAVCVADHLSNTTPVESVKDQASADVILRVEIPKRGPLGGGHAIVTAYLPDGTTALWSGKADLKAGVGWYKFDRGPCGIADQLIATLRDAMRKARDQK